MIVGIIGTGGAGTPKPFKSELNEKLLSDIENILERNLLGRDEDSETVEKIIELFEKSERTQLKWHFKNKIVGYCTDEIIIK
jgi:predicted house-cleaning noncanonical NTP pyrophosphatase (MazG superfamily)